MGAREILPALNTQLLSVNTGSHVKLKRPKSMSAMASTKERHEGRYKHPISGGAAHGVKGDVLARTDVLDSYDSEERDEEDEDGEEASDRGGPRVKMGGKMVRCGVLGGRRFPPSGCQSDVSRAWCRAGLCAVCCVC